MKHNILFITFILSILLSPLSAYSQLSSSGTKEIQLSSQSFSFDGIDIEFKKQLKGNRYFSIGLIDLYAGYRKTEPGSPTTFSTSRLDLSSGLIIGIEKRKSLSETFSFIYGPNLSLSYNFTRNSTENPLINEYLRNIDSYSLNPGILYTIGFMFELKNKLGIGAEFKPGLYYRQSWYESGVEDMNIDYETYFTASTVNISISVIYSW